MRGGKIIPLARFRALKTQRQRPAPGWLGVYRWLWDTSLDRLTDYLQTLDEKGNTMDDLKIEAQPGKNFMTFSRTFDAPRELVWRALSQPEHVIGWWGPHGHQNKVLAFDWQVGGKWKIESTLPDGQIIIFHGEYREIEPPRKVVQTFGVEGMFDGGYSIDTVELEEVDGKTIYRGYSELPSVEARDGMMESGMEVGMRQGFERLDAMLEEWKQEAR